MRSVTFLIPGDPATPTGGYEYDRRIIEGLRDMDWRVSVERLDASFPLPTDAALRQADAVLAAISSRDSDGTGDVALIDGLALGAMPDQVAAHAGRISCVALVHHPLALETGLDAPLAARLFESERRALTSVRRVVVTSRRTAATLADYGVQGDRVVTVEPGTDAAPIAHGSRDGVLSLVCVASISPRKGHDILLRALGTRRLQPWRLVCVGDTKRHPDTLRRLQRILDDCGIGDRVEFVGEREPGAIAQYYDAADVFVMATLYEGYGMVVAEALARGLPVISTPTGAIAELVGDDAGLLVAAGDVDGWGRALDRIAHADERERLAAAARRRRLRLRTWSQAAVEMSEALTFHE